MPKRNITENEIYDAIRNKLKSRVVTKTVLAYDVNEDGSEILVTRRVTEEEKEPDSNLLAKLYTEVQGTERAELELKLLQAKIKDLNGDDSIRDLITKQLEDLRNPNPE